MTSEKRDAIGRSVGTTMASSVDNSVEMGDFFLDYVEK